MPVPTNYPHDDLPAPRVGKSRTEQQNYDTRYNFDGEMLTRLKRDFSTVYYDVTFTVEKNKAALFRLWINNVKNGESFNIDLVTEGGKATHTCVWEQVPLNPQEARNRYTYQGVLYSQRIQNGIDDLTDEEKDFLYDVVAADGIPSIAIAVNENWPNQS